jgi:hypothetical protein
MKELINKVNHLIVKYEMDFEQDDIDTLCQVMGALKGLEEMGKCLKGVSTT